MGLNHESSKGDFPYNNYAAIREESISSNQIASLEIQLKGIQAKITDFNKDNIDGFMKSGLTDLSEAQGEYYRNNENAWLILFERGMAQAITDHSYKRRRIWQLIIMPVCFPHKWKN